MGHRHEAQDDTGGSQIFLVAPHSAAAIKNILTQLVILGLVPRTRQATCKGGGNEIDPTRKSNRLLSGV